MTAFTELWPAVWPMLVLTVTLIAIVAIPEIISTWRKRK